MKTIKLLGIFLATLIFAPLAYAVLPGAYAGLDIGMSRISTESPSGGTKTHSGLGGGLELGMDFNNYFGVEIDLNYYGTATENVPICGTLSTRTSAFEFLGKGMYPIGESGFSLLAKGGFAVARSTSATCSINEDGSFSTGSTTSTKPAMAIGGSYDLSQNLVAEFTFNRIFVNGTIVKNADMVALGLTYHFVDTFCGQFIC